MQYNQPPQLPFNPQQLTNGFLNITLNTPPSVPNYQCNPELQQMLPTISAGLAMTIQQMANENALRIFMFNQYSVNGFRNQDFDELVVLTADYIMLCMLKRQYSNFNQAAERCITEVVAFVAGFNLNKWPSLEMYIDPNIKNTVYKNIGIFQNVLNEIKSMKNPQQQQQQYQQPQSLNMGGYNQPPQQRQYNQYNQQQQNPNNHPAFASSRGGIPSTGGSVFTSNNPPAPTNLGDGTGRNMGGRYNNNTDTFSNVVNQPFEAREAHAMPTNSMETPVVQTDRIPSNELAWHSSKTYPYFYAYDPAKFDLFYKIEQDGTQIPIYSPRDITMMEYDRHSTRRTFNEFPLNYDYLKEIKVIENIAQGILEINGLPPTYTAPGEPPKEVRSVVNTLMFAETNLEAAWFVGDLARNTKYGSNIPDVYRTYAYICQPTISNKSETEAIRNFASSNTFIELREKLNSSFGVINEKLWFRCLNKMTALINRIIRQNLSIPDLTSSNFLEDINDLINDTFLNEPFGTPIRAAFLKHEKELIRAAFLTPNEDIAEELTANLFCNNTYTEENAPKITYLGGQCSLTYLNCASYELELEMTKDISSLVTEALAPMMFQLLKGLFSEVEKLDKEVYQFEHHYIMTNDGIVLETTRGYLAPDTMLLAVVK